VKEHSKREAMNEEACPIMDVHELHVWSDTGKCIHGGRILAK
jgi:hypothetical protein